MHRILSKWRKIVAIQIVVIAVLIIAAFSVAPLSNLINDVANQYATNYSSN